MITSLSIIVRALPQLRRLTPEAVPPITLAEAQRTIDSTLPQLKEALASLQLASVLHDIAQERLRQQAIEGFAAEHDDEHDAGELAAAGAAYALAASDQMHPLSQGDAGYATKPPEMWPWAERWWKPAQSRRNLVKAVALITAEIERIDRAAEKGPST